MLTARPRLALLFALALASATFAAPPALANEAQVQFDKGNAAFEAEKYEDALTAYKAAWKLSKSHDLAYMMGRAEMELGKLRDAAEHLSFALVHFPLTGDQELRTNIETSLAQVKKDLAIVRLQSATKDVTITIDGAKIDSSQLDTDIYLDIGKHTIEATAPGHRSARRVFDFKGGEEETVTLSLPQEVAAQRNPIPGYVMGGVGLVSFVVGAALVGVAEGKKGEAMKLHDEIGSDANCKAQTAKCDALREATAATDSFGNGGMAAMVFGGLFGAASALYLLIPARNKSSTSVPPATGPIPRKKKGSVTIVPVAGASAGGVVLSGSF